MTPEERQRLRDELTATWSDRQRQIVDGPRNSFVRRAQLEQERMTAQAVPAVSTPPSDLSALLAAMKAPARRPSLT
jgi:hypothetical protein